MMLKKLSRVQLDSEVMIYIPDEAPKPIHFEVVEHGGNITLGLCIVKITEQPKCSFCGELVPHSRITRMDKHGMYYPHFNDHCGKPTCGRQSAHRAVLALMDRAAQGDEMAQDRLNELANDTSPKDYRDHDCEAE